MFSPENASLSRIWRVAESKPSLDAYTIVKEKRWSRWKHVNSSSNPLEITSIGTHGATTGKQRF
jgi:hypothetical protein